MKSGSGLDKCKQRQSEQNPGYKSNFIVLFVLLKEKTVIGGNMKKFLMMFALVCVLVGCFGSDAKAQLPFPGQSVPILDQQGFYGLTQGDGTKVWGVRFLHYGSTGLVPPPGYKLWVHDLVYKSAGHGIWLVVSASDGSVEDWPAGDPAHVNTTEYDVRDVDVKSAFGAGTYQIETKIYAYRPAGNGLPEYKFFLWSQTCTFNTQ